LQSDLKQMPYRILNPAFPDAIFDSQCALAVMVKAPRPGNVKTRLCPPLELAQSAALNICFLKDTAANIAQVAASGNAAGIVCYTPVGDEALFNDLLPDSFGLIPQRGEGFGDRLLFAVEDILACGFGAVCLIDSDSPTVPAIAFEQAIAELNRPGDRIVLGGSNDGGYYLIGLKRAHPEPFRNIHWSTSTVYAETLEAARTAGVNVIELPLWYDVDDGATLQILESELLDDTPPVFVTIKGYSAPYSRRFLSHLRNRDEQ
jgi:rSAM/selenodomain-associated transferase 1